MQIHMHIDIRGQKQLQETRRAQPAGWHAPGLKINLANEIHL